MNHGYLYTKDLTVGYNGIPLIRNIQLEINKGEIVTLIGPNGAGKTTILRSIIQQLPPVCGVVWLDGQQAEKMPGKEMAQRLSVVLTERVNPEMMNCEDVVATGRYPYTGKFGILSQEDWKIVRESMELVRITELANRDFNKISDGQKQRVLLARALCQEPELLILDEPTNGLDIPGKSQFRKFIASGMSDDKTIVISTHQVRDIDKVLDHVLIMDDSRVLLDESTSNICDKLFFVESDDRELAKSALFAIPTIQGNYLILPNEKQDESELNLELLFNATLATPEEIARLFHTQK